MRITQVKERKKRFLTLLLLADEQEDMIDRYLSRGDMYALEDGGNVCAVCVVTDEGGGTLEIKNLAVDPAMQKRGYGRMMIEYVSDRYAGQYHTLLVGTGDSPLTLPFYERCGFVRSHVVKDFFTDHYDHPIVEGGVLLRDMVYLRKTLVMAAGENKHTHRKEENHEKDDPVAPGSGLACHLLRIGAGRGSQAEEGRV